MTVSLSAADGINVNAAAAALLSELDDIFTLKAEQKSDCEQTIVLGDKIRRRRNVFA